MENEQWIRELLLRARDLEIRAEACRWEARRLIRDEERRPRDDSGRPTPLNTFGFFSKMLMGATTNMSIFAEGMKFQCLQCITASKMLTFG